MPWHPVVVSAVATIAVAIRCAGLPFRCGRPILWAIIVLPAGYSLFFGREPKAKKDDKSETPANQGELFEDKHYMPMAAE